MTARARRLSPFFFRRKGTANSNDAWDGEKYFEQDEETIKYLTRHLDEESWFETDCASDPTSTMASDQKPREEKILPYLNSRNEALLETKGVFLRGYKEGVTQGSKKFCQVLLGTEVEVPEDSIFREDRFEAALDRIRNSNDARVLRDISQLLVPSAEHLVIFGAKELDGLVESVNEGWNNSIPLTKPRLRSDYAVGFKRGAFTDEQFKKLRPFVDDVMDTSYFMATWYMYFPFITCECCVTSLNIAVRQNAHSMTLAMRGVVELFRLVRREKELSREILAFSVAHENDMVRIYGHYPVIEGRNTTFYVHLIRAFSLDDLDGKEKWTAYKFTRNVYSLWMPDHFKRLCSVIDQLPADLSFKLSEHSELEFQEKALSEEFQSHALSQSNVDSTSLSGENSQATAPEGQDATPETSVSRPPGPCKNPMKAPAERR